MSEQKQQRPLIAKGSILEWSGSRLEVVKIGSQFMTCKIVASGNVVNVPFSLVGSAVVLTEEQRESE